MHKLLIEDDEGRTTEVPVSRDVITIGRKGDNYILLDERNISRHHARLERVNGRIYLVDLNSRYGIKLNGHRVRERVQLQPGDLLVIGSFQISLELEGNQPHTFNRPPPLPTYEQENPEDDDDAPAADTGTGMEPSATEQEQQDFGPAILRFTPHDTEETPVMRPTYPEEVLSKDSDRRRGFSSPSPHLADAQGGSPTRSNHGQRHPSPPSAGPLTGPLNHATQNPLQDWQGSPELPMVGSGTALVLGENATLRHRSKILAGFMVVALLLLLLSVGLNFYQWSTSMHRPTRVKIIPGPVVTAPLPPAHDELIRARVYTSLEQWPQAIRILDQALEKDPHSGEARALRDHSEMEQGNLALLQQIQLSLARGNIDEAVSLKYQITPQSRYRARAEEALLPRKRMVEQPIEPSPPEAEHPEVAELILQARQEAEEGRLKPALRTVQRALRIDRNNVEAMRIKALLTQELRRGGRRVELPPTPPPEPRAQPQPGEGATRPVEPIAPSPPVNPGKVEPPPTTTPPPITTVPPQPPASNNLDIVARAVQLQGAGKREEAIAEYHRAIAANPSYFFPYKALGFLYAEQNQKQKACEFLKKFVTMNSQDRTAGKARTYLQENGCP